MLTTHAGIIQALAREDAIWNNESPHADLAITLWRRDCADETKAVVWIHGESIRPAIVVEALDVLGLSQAAEIYAEEWKRIAAQRAAPRGAYDISQEIDTLRRLLMEASANKDAGILVRAGILARIDRLTDDLHGTQRRGR